jgi:hypothetical protein
MTDTLPQPPLAPSGGHFREFEIPEDLPGILRAFAKAAIKEQPQDINAWAFEYFTKLSAADTREPSRPPSTAQTPRDPARSDDGQSQRMRLLCQLRDSLLISEHY